MSDKCYQCMDKGLLIIPMKAQNGMMYDYMFQCSCNKGHYFNQLPVIDISIKENREFLKKLAKNYEQRKTEVKVIAEFNNATIKVWFNSTIRNIKKFSNNVK